MPLYKRITQYLHDIIDQAYADDTPAQRAKYKKFKLYLLRDEKNNSSGDYDSRTHQILIYNMSRGTSYIAKSCLHELAHHIDFMQHGTTGHQKPFYDAYTKLIYASIDMGILAKDDFLDDTSSHDAGKVRKIIEHYVPRPVDYKTDMKMVCQVSRGYKQKEDLRKRGYTWNSIEQFWEKEIEDQEAEEKFLKGLGLENITFSTPKMKIDPVIYVTASGRTYDVKDILKELGFRWDQDRKIFKQKTTPEGAQEIFMEVSKRPELKYITFKKE